MPDAQSWRYYTAVAASGLSVIGWIAAVVAGAAALYYSVTSGPVVQYSTYFLVALGAGVAFALLEKRLYRGER